MSEACVLDPYTVLTLSILILSSRCHSLLLENLVVGDIFQRYFSLCTRAGQLYDLVYDERKMESEYTWCLSIGPIGFPMSR